MRLTIKKIIKAFIPYGIIILRQCINERHQIKVRYVIKRCILKDFILNKEYRMRYKLINNLIKKEKKYGGFVTNVKNYKVSKNDPRSKHEIETGYCTGGDRMLYMGYASKYAEYLPLYLGSNNITLVEIGILKGSGLAIWCDLFPSAKILGLDVDLENIYGNMENLKRLGAFTHNTPDLLEFDQFDCDNTIFENYLNGRKINIFIDDAYHSDEAILNTLRCVEPYLANNFVYFIEDNKNVHRKIKEMYPQFKVDYENELTILTR